MGWSKQQNLNIFTYTVHISCYEKVLKLVWNWRVCCCCCCFSSISLKARGVVSRKQNKIKQTKTALLVLHTYNLQHCKDCKVVKIKKTCRNDFFCFWLPPTLFKICRESYCNFFTLPKKAMAKTMPSKRGFGWK